jgi:hypothetical protein
MLHKRVSSLFKLLGLVALVALLNFPAYAWEMTMQGDAEWRYRYWTRTGDQDIFGPMDGRMVYLGINHLATFPTAGYQNGIGAAFGVRAGENCYGKEMSFVDQRMTLYPRLIINPAITIDAGLNLTSLGIWSDGQPLDSSATSTPGFVNSLYVPIGEGNVGVNVPNTYLTLQYLKLGITTPMLNFSFGYKASSLGIGLWKAPCNYASTSFDVFANYGPFIIGFSPFFARSQSSWATNGTSRNTGAGSYQRQEQRRNYILALEGYVVYRAADLEVGISSDSYVQQHANRVNARLAALTGASVTTRPDQDDVRYRVTSYFKYFNGRFFANAEATWFNRWRGGRGTANPASAASPANLQVQRDQDVSAWLYGAEFGSVCGPTKLTLSYVRATGQDPASRYVNEDSGIDGQGASACFMRDWGLLMYYMYGTGTGWDPSGWGQPTDFHHAGARLDYAVASNLNLFAVYSYAWRDQPTGYTLGGDLAGGARLFTNDDLAQAQGRTITGAAAYFGQTPVPDSARDIGYEIDAGFNWKLLENLMWGSTFAYWTPGNWWAYAYPNTAAIYRANGGATIVANTAGNRPAALFNLDRHIDPLFAVETKLTVSF